MKTKDIPDELRIIKHDILNNDSDISELQNELASWSDNTFGANRQPKSPLCHLKLEIEELIREPYDRMEYADCFNLLLDAYRMAGGSADDLVLAGKQKLEICKKRKWGKPDANGVVQHIKETHD